LISLHPAGGVLDVLCLGAHPDDIEIGCGGTLLGLAGRPGTRVTGVVLTGSAERRREAQNAFPRFVPGATVEVLDLPDGRLPSVWGEVKERLEDVAARQAPTLIFAPRTDDAHQDHRLLGRLVHTVWRDVLVLHYEIPKWDGDLTSPSHYVDVPADQARLKVNLLRESFPSQSSRDWWDDELFLGLMRVHGVENRSRYAEAFSTSKVRLQLAGRVT
jgi:LmbE family N-acetylglucosaminyl deacetylase